MAYRHKLLRTGRVVCRHWPRRPVVRVRHKSLVSKYLRAMPTRANMTLWRHQDSMTGRAYGKATPLFNPCLRDKPLFVSMSVCPNEVGQLQGRPFNKVD